MGLGWDERTSGSAHRGWGMIPLVVRYGVAGAATQALYLGTFALALGARLPYVVAIVVAQAVAIGFAFPVYRARVFRAGEGSVSRQFLAFLGVWWVGAAASLVGVPLLVELIGLGPFVAQLVVVVSVFGLSFVAHRSVTFAATAARPEGVSVQSGAGS